MYVHTTHTYTSTLTSALIHTVTFYFPLFAFDMRELELDKIYCQFDIYI